VDALSEEARALDTTERVLAALRLLPDRDEALDALIDRIDDDRAHLVAAIIGSQALRRRSLRLRRPVIAAEDAWPPRTAGPVA